MGAKQSSSNTIEGVNRNSKASEGHKGSESNVTYGSGNNLKSMEGVSRGDEPPGNKDPGSSGQEAPDKDGFTNVSLSGGRRKRSRKRTRRKSHKRRSHKRRSNKRSRKGSRRKTKKRSRR